MIKLRHFQFGLFIFVVSIFTVACAPVHDEAVSSSSSDNLTVDESLQTEALDIIQFQCSGCHGANGSGGVSNITDVDHLIASGLIVPGDPSQGRLLGSINDGSMPMGAGTVPGLPQADVDTIAAWISSMQTSSSDLEPNSLNE